MRKNILHVFTYFLSQMAFKLNHKNKVLLLILLSIVVTVITFMFKRIPQSLTYHQFADRRPLWGLPNGWNVLSNIPFLFIGMFGFSLLGKSSADKRFNLIYTCLFIGIFFTGLGSAYYHYRPDNNTLVYDRLPMTIAFMSLLSATIAESIDLKTGRRLLFPLLIIGVGSVLLWHFTELKDAGDLRLYGLVQFYPILLIPLILMLFPSSQNKSALQPLMMAVIWYIIAKILEHFDKQIYSLGEVVSGHSLKHLAAAFATWYLVLLFIKKHVNQVAANAS